MDAENISSRKELYFAIPDKWLELEGVSFSLSVMKKKL